MGCTDIETIPGRLALHRVNRPLVVEVDDGINRREWAPGALAFTSPVVRLHSEISKGRRELGS